MLEISSLFALTATYLRERKVAASEATAEEFRQWLQDEAIPRILGSSDDVLEAIQEIATSQHDKLDAILGRLDSLGRELSLHLSDDTWESLSDSERSLLRHLYHGVLGDPYFLSNIDSVAEELGSDAERLSHLGRRLDERGLAQISESTGGIGVRISGAGILLAWKFDSQRDASAELSELNEMVRGLSRSDSLRVREITDKTGIPTGLVDAYCQALSELGHAHYVTGYGSVDSNLLNAPSESFLEKPPTFDEILSKSLE